MSVVVTALLWPGAAGAANMQMISLDASVIDFGTQVLNETAPLQALTIRNTGSDPLFISDLSLSSVNANDLAAFDLIDAPVGGTTLAPQGSIVVKLEFTPVRDGNYSARLTILSDDRNNGAVAVTLVGRGLANPIVVDPATIDFGIFRFGADPGSTNTRAITITNNAPSAVTLLDPVIGGMRPGDFTCTVVRTIGAKKSATAMVTYRANAIAFASAQIQFPVVGIGLQSGVLAVSGQTVQTLLTVAPSVADPGVAAGTLDFGQRLFLGSPAAVRLVKVTNNTVQPLSIASLAVNDPRFTINPGNAIGRPIAAGGSAEFSLAYVPAKLGIAQGRLTVTVVGIDGDDGGLELVATVVPPPLEGGGAACSLGTARGQGSGRGALLLVPGLALLLVVARRRRGRARRADT